MSSDESRLSTIQKMCINTIKTGAITAFIDVFRLTHMEQPMGKNQPTNLNDLVSTSGPTVTEIIHKFTFDNPLNFSSEKLHTVQSLLVTADSCQMNEDYFGRFEALSKLVDLFVETQIMRTQLRMLPLVTPHPIITTLNEESDTIGCADILSLITSPIFIKSQDPRDPLMAAVAQIKAVDATMHMYCPLDVYYGILARNTLYDMVRTLENANSIAGLMHDVLPSINSKTPSDFTPSDPTTVPRNLKTRILLYTITCYLRLGKSLHFFQLYRAAHGVLDVCLVAIAALEQHLNIDFSSIFEPTVENTYKVLIPDDISKDGQTEARPTNSPRVKQANFASARLDLNSTPFMPFTRLEEETLPTSFSSDPNETYESYIETLAEFVFIARMMMAHNLMSIACTAFSNAISEADLMFVRADVIALHSKITQSKQSIREKEPGSVTFNLQDENNKVEETLSISSLVDPIALPVDKVLPNMPCSYICALSGCVLLMNAADIAFGFNIYPLIIPICRRLFELVTRLDCVELVAPYMDKLLAGDIEFAILGHSWAANWASARGDNKSLVHHLLARWSLANQGLSNNAELLAEINKSSGDDLANILNRIGTEEYIPPNQANLSLQKSRVRFDVASALNSVRSASASTSMDPLKSVKNLDLMEDAGGLHTNGHVDGTVDILDDLNASLLNPEEMLLTDNTAKSGLREVVDIPIQISDTPSTPTTHNSFQTDSEMRAYESTQKLLRSAGVPSVGRDMGSSGVLEPAYTKQNQKTMEAEAIRRNIIRARAMVGAREAVAAASALSCAGNTKANGAGAAINDLELMTGAWNTIAEIYEADESAKMRTNEGTAKELGPAFASTSANRGPAMDATTAGSELGLGKRSSAETMEKMIAEERRGVSTSVVEARVRLGAVRGQLLVQQTLGSMASRAIEDANEDDLNLIVEDGA